MLGGRNSIFLKNTAIMEKIKSNSDLKDIIVVLTMKFDIEQIYLNLNDPKLGSHKIVILVSNKYLKTLGELVPRITNAIRDYPDYRISCYIAFQAKDKILNGNLFLFTSCVPERLIFKKEDSEFVLIPETFSLDKFSKKVYALRNKELQKVDEFKEGYFFYKEKEQYSMAAFMIHQAIELTYRYLGIVLSAKERIKHSIRGHHHSLQEITTMYDSIFDDENNTDQYLLNVLEDIYRATRYEDNFNVKLETLNLLEIKMNQLHSNASNIYDTVISSFEKSVTTDCKVADENIDINCKPVDVPKSNLDGKIVSSVEKLKSLLPEDISVYLFGYRAQRFEMESVCENSNNGKYYFDFLIVSREDIREQVSNAQAILNEDANLSVLLLSHKVDQIQKRLDENNIFFHKVLHYKLPVSDCLNVSWSFHENNGTRVSTEVETARSKWYGRKNNALGFFNGGKAIDSSEEVVVKVSLFNQAVEQTCLGLLEFFYGYRPYQHNLNHLYSLCCSFWHFPNDIFSRSTVEEKGLFKEFVDVVKDVRYAGLSYIDWDDAYRYEARCERFLDECSKLVCGE